MSNLRQIEANRRNAAKSTGPRTESGKAVTRLNALKTGIDAATQVLPGESPEEFAALLAEYYDRHRPSIPEQRLQVDILVSCEWLLRRLRRVEHQIWETEFRAVAQNEYVDQERPFGESYKRRDETFRRLQYRINSTYRQMQTALRALREFPAPDPPDAPPEAPPPGPQPFLAETITPQIGFVPPPSASSSVPLRLCVKTAPQSQTTLPLLRTPC